MNAENQIDTIRELCSFDGRLAGTDAERRAANRFAERLRATGRRVDVEPTYVHPQANLAHALHCLLGFAGSLIAVAIPALGFGLVLLAATSMYLDLNYRAYLLRSLFFRRASQNVLARGRGASRGGQLILCAHLDAGRGGAFFAPRRARLAARLAAGSPLPLGAFRILFWSLAALLPPLGARMAGVESDLLSLLQLLPTLALLVGAFALVEGELSPISPGANDNASGVATALWLLGELDRDPPENLDVWLLLTGGEVCQQEGMARFLRAHRRELDPEATTVVAIDTVGRGDLRYEASAGWVVSYGMDGRLIELCDAIADADRDGAGRYRARPLRNGAAMDSLPPRLRRYRSIGLTCRPEQGPIPDHRLRTELPESLDPDALDRAGGFALELIRALDRDADPNRGHDAAAGSAAEPVAAGATARG